MDAEIIIIGGGVLGVSLAYHLSVQGKHCLLIEREDQLGIHASGKNAGMFRQLYRNPQLTEWAKRSRLLWPTSLRSTCFQETGSVIVGRELPGHHPELFEQIETSYTENRTRKKVPAIFTATDGLLDQSRYVRTLFELRDPEFAHCLLSEKVRAVVHASNSWQVQTESGKTFEAPVLVNAAGAWLNSFLEPYCSWLSVDVAAFARHLFVGEDFTPDFMPHQGCGYYWDEQRDWYIRTNGEGRRILSICDRTPADPDSFLPDQDIVDAARFVFANLLPAEAGKIRLTKAWSCFRTYTDDQLPLWGEDPDAAGLFWLGAFGGFGMSTSFAATLDAARAIAGERVEISSDFTPSRAKIASFPLRSGTII